MIARATALALILAASACASVQWGYYRTSVAVKDPAFPTIMAALADGPMTGGNDVRILVNGDEIFDAMLEAIRGATQTVHLESYIIKEDAIGRRFIDALIERARAGVRVRVITDPFGDDLSPATKERMRAAGVEIVVFNPFNWFHPLESNLRSHRKNLVVDGRIGFAGGVGIDERWAGNAEKRGEWRETHVRVEGPVVAQMQRLFAETWRMQTGELLDDPGLYPRLEPAGHAMAAVVGEWRADNWSNIREMFLLALAAARERCWMNIAYFSPDPDFMRALRETVERGVDVRLITTGTESDMYANWLLAQKNYGRLLETGLHIYEYTGTNMHAKSVVADGLFSTIGSANFDNRTFNYNLEINLVFLDEKVAGELEELFLRDLARSVEVSYHDWKRRPVSRRFFEQMVGVIEGWM
ncbi:cardiolipin synthase B [bacterium]|nr:cardiolipin synthase B [bacterium]